MKEPKIEIRMVEGEPVRFARSSVDPLFPAHATFPIVQLERLVCRELGHRAIEYDAEPVSTFHVCLRCGKFWR